MEQWYRRIISGEAAGLLPALVRGLLRFISWPYGAVVYVRNRAFDRGVKPVVKLPVPVISVGNITTGGTGKTPTVIMVVKYLEQLGKRPAVLTRGYGAPRGGVADEVLVIRQSCPGVPVVVNPDRVAGGREAIEKHQAEVLVLDDGFQHRRIGRDMNIVLIDATSPMGIPGLFPRGSWREPPGNLSRATHIMLTRCEQVSPELADLAADLLSQWVGPKHIYQQSTQVTGLFDAAGRAVPLAGQPVVLFAGVGNPDGFLSTVRSLGLHVLAGCWFGDHHNYDVGRDFAAMEASAREHRACAYVTTQKDAVKLNTASRAGLPIWHVRIESCIRNPVQEHQWRSALAEVTGAGCSKSAGIR